MRIHSLAVGPFESNCYVLAGHDRMALLVDPGADERHIIAMLQSIHAAPVAVLLTHGHVDHISGLAGVLDVAPVPVYLHPADLAWAFHSANQLPPYYAAPGGKPADVHPVRDGERIEIGGVTLKVIATPGHTPGGVCYHFPATGDLFTGDTLFHGSVGRTDLPGGDSRALTSSLCRLATLPPETRIWPGHGPGTTLGIELRTNPFFAPLRR